MLLSQYSLRRASVKLKTQSCTTALIMQPSMFSHSFCYSMSQVHGWWKPCPAWPLTPSARTLSRLPASHFSSLAKQRIWQQEQAEREAASFGIRHSPSVILEHTQSQRSEKDSKKKQFWKALDRSIPLPPQPAPSPSLLPAPSLPTAPITMANNWPRRGESHTDHLPLLITPPLLLQTLPHLSYLLACFPGETTEQPAGAREAQTGTGHRHGSALGWHQVTVALTFKRCFSPPKTYHQKRQLRYCRDIYAYPFEHLNLKTIDAAVWFCSPWCTQTCAL